MGLAKKILTLSVILGIGILPSLAKIDGKISKSHFYDTEKTIMPEVTPDKTPKTEKYWEKNLLYFNKYRPLFMLTNKELYDLMPKDNVGIVQRISAPAIYNVSLKTATIKKVSLSQPKAVPQAKKFEPQVKTAAVEPKHDSKMISFYEQAKNPDVEPEQKMDVATMLKDSKNPANYDLAIDLLDDVTRKEPYNAYAYYLKGEVYTQKNDSTNAVKNYAEALKINPLSKQCYLNIAKILEPTNKELAQKYYDMAK